MLTLLPFHAGKETHFVRNAVFGIYNYSVKFQTFVACGNTVCENSCRCSPMPIFVSMLSVKPARFVRRNGTYTKDGIAEIIDG
jgi:hypothetical protein